MSRPNIKDHWHAEIAPDSRYLVRNSKARFGLRLTCLNTESSIKVRSKASGTVYSVQYQHAMVFCVTGIGPVNASSTIKAGGLIVPGLTQITYHSLISVTLFLN
jgi:hypothetical protein